MVYGGGLGRLSYRGYGESYFSTLHTAGSDSDVTLTLHIEVIEVRVSRCLHIQGILRVYVIGWKA
jgi:hypothetical protein